ncbi:MAG: hypothetical protein GXX96_22805 [Planctomycetaceae bacterium]|jgi:hypothetical protein|nr:hypothetical protein [Planctomycetaceae bacterium]
MRKHFAISCFFLVGMIAFGCRQEVELAPSEQATTPSGPAATEVSVREESTQPGLAALRYDTGDVKKWPDYQFPLEHTFVVPEVPPEIVGPFTADDIPDRPAED